MERKGTRELEHKIEKREHRPGTDDGLDIISIFHGCMVWIENSVTRVTDRQHEACRVMPSSDPE